MSSEPVIEIDQTHNEPEYWDGHFANTDASVDRILAYYADRRFSAFQTYLSHPSLEIGPGIGEFAERAAITDVLDVSRESLRRVKERIPEIEARQYTELPLPYDTGSLGSIVCNDVLHHVKESIDLEAYAKELHRVLREEGMLLIADRRPGLLNKLFLKANQIGRKLYLKMAPSRSVTSGKIELEMTKSDYSGIYDCFDVVTCEGFRGFPMVLVNAASFFVSLLIPQKYLARPLFYTFDLLERRLPILPLDQLLVLRKKGP